MAGADWTTTSKISPPPISSIRSSDDFSVGYEAGWVGRAKQRDIEADRLKAQIGLLELRLRQVTARAEAAEKRADIAERKLGKQAKG